MARCNLTEEEQLVKLQSPVWGLRTGEELDALRHQFRQYLILDNDEAGTEWHCTGCQQAGYMPKSNREVYRAKHNDILRCPYCGEGYQVKRKGRIRSGAKLYETAAVSFVNVDSEGAVYIESGIGFWDYDYDFGMDETFLAKKRYYLAPGKVQEWKRSLNMDWWTQTRRPDAWEPAVNISEPFAANWMYGFDGFGQFIGLEKLRSSALKYSAINQYFEDYHSIGDIEDPKQPLRLVQKYLAEYALRPSIEMAVKLGHSDIVGELVRDGKTNGRDVNWSAKSPAGFCRMTKQEYNTLHELLDASTLRQYHQMKRSGLIRTAEEAETIFRGIGTGKLKERAEGICKELGLNLIEASKYLAKQKNDKDLWPDYIDMAGKLGYDLSEQTVIFPKNLRERHDAAAETIKAEATEKQRKAYAARKKLLEKKYGFRMDGMVICIPKDAEEIIAEGKTLHHCVGGYAERHITGKTNILFLRHERKPNTPYITIELDTDGYLRQIHGYKNERYPHAVSPQKLYADFLSTWQSWYRAGSHRDMNGEPILKTKEESIAV